MTREFDLAYKNLNNDQKKAVDYIDGPLLVVAGPGTGKTQLLSVRVANILKKTDTEPGSIICLTFTNFAAINMKDRIHSLIGNDAYKINIQTFHSFAADIMTNYPEYFWNGAKLTIVPDAVQLDIIKTILEKLPLSHPLSTRFANNLTAIKDVLSGLKLIKEAGLTPDKLIAMIEANKAYIDLIEPQLVNIFNSRLSLKDLKNIERKVLTLPDQSIDQFITPLQPLSKVLKGSLSQAINIDSEKLKTTNTSKWKTQWIQNINGQKSLDRERKRNDWWSGIGEVYKMYRAQLHTNGYYDYSDMIVEVNYQLEHSSELLNAVQEKYFYMLIDEFQDANSGQLRLAHLVANHPVHNNRPNIMAVGDDDQSIYAFNGAELNNMLTFINLYNNVKTVVLTDNYRSTNEILKSAESIISLAQDRLVNQQGQLNKNLKAVANIKHGQINHIVYPTKDHQLSLIAKHIKHSYSQNPDGTVAVLARTNSSLVRLSSYLLKAGVNVSYEQQNNILEYEIIQQIILIGQVVEAINKGDITRSNHYLSRLLTHEMWQIKPKDIWLMALSNSKKGSDWLNYLLNSKIKELNNLAKFLIWLSSESEYQTLLIMLEYIIGLRSGSHYTSPIRQYYIKDKNLSNHYLISLSGLKVLIDLTREYTLSKATRPKLSDFLGFINVNNELNQTITDDSWFVSGDRALQLMTVHKAKGLEFDHVYILDAIDSEWRPNNRGRKAPANLPFQPYGEVLDDYARLAYVAATRAKQSLTISSFLKDNQGKSVIPSTLFSNIANKVYNDVKNQKLESINMLEQSLSWPILESTDTRSLLKPRIDNFKLTATGLLSYLDIINAGPQSFLEQQILRLPEITTEYVAYGNAMHRALQVAQNLVNQNKYNINKVILSFNEALDEQNQPLRSIDKFRIQGQETLKSLLIDAKVLFPPNARAELVIKEKKINNAIISGTLDHIYLNDNKLIITDYKTGQPLKNFNTKSQTGAVKAWRHKRQLLFYCLLINDDNRISKVTETEAQILYIDAKNKNEIYLRLEPKDEDIIRMQKLVETVWRKVKNCEFKLKNNYPKSYQGIVDFEEDLINKKV